MDRVTQALDAMGTLYHVTAASRLKGILAYGLMPNDIAGAESRADSRPAHVYLSDRECAEDYLAAHQHEAPLVLLAVDCAELKPWNLGADEQNFGYHGKTEDTLALPREGESAEKWSRRVGLDSEDNVVRSLELGSVAYQGTIAPTALRVVLATPELSDLAQPAPFAQEARPEPLTPSL